MREEITMQGGFLRCTIVQGMFKDEYGVIIHLGLGRSATSYVDKQNVIDVSSGNGREGRLRVFIKGDTPTGTLIYLPAETSTGQRTLLVSPDLVEYEPA